MAGQDIKHPKPCPTHADQRDIYLETVPRLRVAGMWKVSYVPFSLTLQFISYHDLHIHSILSNVPTERPSISNSTCLVAPSLPRDTGSQSHPRLDWHADLAARSGAIASRLSSASIPDLHRTCSHSRAPWARPLAG